MNLREQYKKETGKNAFQNCEASEPCPTDDYVEWLEKQIENKKVKCDCGAIMELYSIEYKCPSCGNYEQN